MRTPQHADYVPTSIYLCFPQVGCRSSGNDRQRGAVFLFPNTVMGIVERQEVDRGAALHEMLNGFFDPLEWNERIASRGGGQDPRVAAARVFRTSAGPRQ